MLAYRVSNHTKEIAMDVIPTDAPNTDGYQKGRFLTNFSLYLKNDARRGHNYHVLSNADIKK